MNWPSRNSMAGWLANSWQRGVTGLIVERAGTRWAKGLYACLANF